MKKAEYDSLIEIANNPYLGFINKRREKKEFVSPEDTVAAKEKLFGMGFLVLAVDEKGIDDEFFLHAAKLAEDEKACLIYCDEDVCEIKDPFFKPDFSPDTLKSFFYFGGAVAIRIKEFEELPINEGEKTAELTPSMQVHVAERVLEKFWEENLKYDEAKKCFIHIPKVLYHSPLKNYYKYPKAVEFTDIKKSVERDIEDTLKSLNEEKISAVILSRDNPKMAIACIDSLINNADTIMEIIVVDNGSLEENKKEYERELLARGVSYFYHPMDFEYSTLCNYGVSKASGRFILLLNDDIILPESESGFFPSKLLKKAKMSHVGAVGIKLLYPSDGCDNRIQHAGMTMLSTGPSHRLATLCDDVVHEYGRNRHTWNVMGVTGACLLVDREKFSEVGFFDESIKISYTDTDLCLCLLEKGYYNVCLNDEFLYHHESVSRGSDIGDEKKLLRLNKERERLYEKHPWLLNEGDPFGNENLSGHFLEFRPDYNLPWEEAFESGMIPELSSGSFAVRDDDKKLLGSVDRAEVSDGILTIEGWSILQGRNQLNVQIVVEVSGSEGKKYYETVRKYRQDLETVFPKEKNHLLNGFVARIPANLAGTDYKIRFGIVYKNIFGKKILVRSREY